MSRDRPPVHDPAEPVTREQPDSTTAILAGARHRLATNPRVMFAFLVAGLVVAGIDWLQFHDAVPATRYVGVESGRFAATFRVVVAPESRATTPPAAFLHLTPRWLAWTVGLVFLKFLTVVAASVYGLATLLETDVSAPAVVRYAAVVTVMWLGVGRVEFEGAAALFGLPLVVLFFVVAVRLVPFPGRLVLGESVRTALSRSWGQATGHGWALFGVVLVVGVPNHLLTSVPVVGPVGSGLVAAVHAAVVATVCTELPVSADDANGAEPAGAATGDR